MKKFILLFIGLFLFDVIYIIIYDEFLAKIESDIIQYPLIIVYYLASSPAIFFNKFLPLYAPIEIYLSILILFGNVLIQTFLIQTIFFKHKSNKKHVD